MLDKERKLGVGRPFSAFIVSLLVFGALFVALPSIVPTASAGYVDHTIGNLDLMGLTDWGSLGFAIEYNGVPQIASSQAGNGEALCGVIFDQASYNHTDPYAIADSYDSGWGTMENWFADFNVTTSDVPMHFEIDNATTQKSSASFTQVDQRIPPIGVANDVRIHQSTWTLAGKDWALMEWTIENIQGTDIFEANFGFGCWITGNPSIPNDDTGVGGDEWDDMDGWDSQNNIYYVSDDFGTGEVLGFSSAVPTTPFSHHYSNALLNLADDKGVYNALTGPDLTAGGPMTKITAILSWNGYTIQAGTSLTFAMVIAHGADVMSMRQTVWDAQNYYFTETTGVYITEFEDSSSPTQRIEVYNRGQTAVDLSQWEVRNRMGALLTGNWVPDSDLPVGEHRYLDVMSGTLDPEGDIISLYGDTAFLVDSIGYGQFGIAPDPVAGEASSRVWNPGQGRYTNDWTMTISGLSIQTFGAQNTVPSVDSNPLIVLNEVLYYHTPSWERFIELRYIWDGTLDISNFMIVGNGIYTIPGPASVDKNVPAYYFTESADASAAALFASLSTGGDNLYLYNDAGVLLDMVGWTSLHCIDESARRVPEGSGAHNGYDDVSSLAAGWRFCERPGLPLILLEADQKKGTDINTLVSYDLKITNLKNDFDVVDVMLESSVPSGSSADFYSGDGAWTPLTDTDGDGDADIGVLKPNGLAMFESINVTVNITISLNPQNYRENTTIGAQSNTSIYGYDPAFLSTEVSPYINVNKSVNPKSIYTSPDRAQVTVNLTGAGIPQSFSKPQDTVFIIDSSGSMGGSRMPSYPGACISPGNDPGGIRIQAVKQYIDKMSDEDRAAIIGFAADPDHNYLGGAWLTQDVAFFGPVEPHHFRNTETGNKTLIKNDTDTLLFCGGGTNTEMALQFALLELVPGYVPGPLSNPTGRTFPIDNPGDTDGIRYGNDTHWWIIILLTDGDPSHPESATNDEVAFAAANNVRIYTIGLGNVDESYLNQSIAQPTGGEYIYAAKAEDLPQVYERIRTLINNLAGSPIVTPMPQPMVTDIVPPELIVDISSINPAPKSTWTNATGTYIQWDANTILIGESWIATYDVGCILPMSNQNVTKYPFASVDYVSWDDRIIQAPIPSDYITCTAPPSPYITNVEIEPGGVKVTWNGIPGADLYEIYGGPDQTALNLDLADVLDSTSAPQTTWIDANRISTNPDEYYYVVRAIYTDSNPTIRSATSNTGGYYRIQFDAGLNTFSLPLQPFAAVSLNTLMAYMGASSISWIDANDDWKTWPPSLAPNARIGEGYVVGFPEADSYVFTGEPASMVIYRGSIGFSFGFDDVTRDDIAATMDAAGSVLVSWTAIPGTEKYYVYKSNTRDGFFTSNYSVDEVTTPLYKDTGAVNVAGELYYIIVPYESAQGYGSSTYSIGVITAEYNGKEFFGLPLEPVWGAMSADWYADSIPYALGIVFLENGVWIPHFKEFDQGVYDTIVEFGRGYKVSVYKQSLYTYVGW